MQRATGSYQLIHEDFAKVAYKQDSLILFRGKNKIEKTAVKKSKDSQLGMHTPVYAIGGSTPGRSPHAGYSPGTANNSLRFGQEN